MLPPVVDQSITHTPLTALSAVAFALAGLAALWLSLRRPQWAAALLAFSIPFAFYRDVLGTTVTLEKVVIIGVAIGLVMRGAPLVPAGTAARRILIASLVVLAAIALSGIGATYAGPVLREALKQLEYIVMFWCAASLIVEQRDDARWLEAGLISGVFVVAVDAIAQGLVGGAPSGVWINGHRLPRVAGPLEGPNQLAGFLEISLPVLLLSPLLFGERLRVPRWIALFAVALAIPMTLSRSGVAFALFAFVLVWFVDRAAARRSWLPFAAGTVAGFAIAFQWYWGATHSFALLGDIFRLSEVPLQDPGGVGTRNELWSAALTMFAAHPLLGVGAGNFEHLLGSVGLVNVQTHANSLWLQTLAEQGLVGFVALLALYVVVLRECSVGLASSWLARAALIATLCMLLHQVVDDLFFFPKVGLLWWLLVGAAAGDLAGARAPAPAPVAPSPTAELAETATPIA
ncbi:MAG: O-antigen ligase family protein [Candidatus Eremiobacteraeota bacterium]|nr:O-antigen ligase family protein [Candidatus Eremiobacteraeota bacterium]